MILVGLEPTTSALPKDQINDQNILRISTAL